MRRPLSIMALVAVTGAWPAAASDFTLNGSAAYDQRQYDDSSRDGIEQRLTLGWRRTFFTPISFRLLFRTEDFRGTEENGSVAADSHTRTMQPIAELSYVVGGFTAGARHDTILSRAQLDGQSSKRTTERTAVSAGWTRARFPTFNLTGQRHRVDQSSRTVEDDTAAASVSYGLGNLLVSGISQRGRQLDASAGYERTSQNNGAFLDWRGDLIRNRLSANVSGNASLATYSQRATIEGGTRIPFPVIVSRALVAVDDTPEDSRDHPPVSNSALIDGSLNIASGVSLGPDAVSYQNLVLDLGRTETLDEIRLIVRDERGDPVKRVGLISFDVYTSIDGQLWTPLTGPATRWDAAVSYYEIAFSEARSRWFKVVTFGVNPEPTLLTEIQAFYHRALAQGQDRETSQKLYGGQVALTATPTSRLTLHYGGDYHGTTVEDTASIARTQTELRHDLGAEVRFGRGMTVGAAVSERAAEATTLPDESDRSYNAFFRGVPSRRFDFMLDFTRRDSERSFDAYTMDTIALHSKIRVLKALTFSVDAGQDSITARDVTGTDSARQYLDLRTEAQLYPSMRVSLHARAAVGDHATHRDAVNRAPALRPALRPRRGVRGLESERAAPAARSLQLGLVGRSVRAHPTVLRGLDSAAGRQRDHRRVAPGRLRPVHGPAIQPHHSAAALDHQPIHGSGHQLFPLQDRDWRQDVAPADALRIAERDPKVRSC
jgi:hypothetical protein